MKTQSQQQNNKPPQQMANHELCRFGHSIILLNPNIAILFGGAKGRSNQYIICNDTYLFKIEENTWIKINRKELVIYNHSASGEIPCARAAHAAVSLNDNRMIIYGGAKQDGSLAPDDLHVFDFTTGEIDNKWYKCIKKGLSPGGRYGHSICYFKPFIIVFGGNLGNKTTNDVWRANLEESSITWMQLEIKGDIPSPRMYHSSALCQCGGANNMMIVFGGRVDNSTLLNDCWGLRKHRSGYWDWLRAPYSKDYQPFKRIQHTINFFYNFLIVIGGRSVADNKSIPIEIYDTESSEWESVAYFNKFRHTSWIVDNSIYTHGGFELSNTINAKNDIIKIDLIRLFNSNEMLKKKLEKLTEGNLKKISNIKKLTPTISPTNSNSEKSSQNRTGNLNMNYKKGKKTSVPMSSIMNEKPLIQKKGEIAIVSNNKDDKLIIKKIIFDDKWKIKMQNDIIEKPLYEDFLDYLLQPPEWLNKKDDESKNDFKFSIEQIATLTHQCIEIVASQPNVIYVSAPVKVFGDIHGQYIDLMNFFNQWGSPCENMNGDIMSNDYLFLGDYVDRGNLSLETICLLIALKVKYPDQIHLLRGNHEDILINSGFGFQEECEKRLKDDSESEDSLFNLLNSFFEYLPFAAIIEEQILCLHGGIGANVKKISDIENIKRPFEVIHEAKTHEQKLVMDILWSDPTDTDEELGIQPNIQRDSNNYGNIVKYGPDIVKQFLQNNNLSYIIRAHECVLDGFERFAGGLLITVFSATDYCGRHNNAGAMLVINQQKTMIPHLIYPPDGGNNNWIDDDEYYETRPPTPPRIRYNKTTY